jgi:phage gp36-like protein
MAFLEKSDLESHLYEESIDVITREDDDLVTAAIDAAIGEAKGYLGAYDTDSIFDEAGSDRNALLLVFCKDIAIWHLVVLCNAGADMALRQDRYERAIAWLKGVQKGDIAADLPKAEDEDGEETGAIIRYGSNDQRTNHF